jgi:signal transduction histidine kinase
MLLGESFTLRSCGAPAAAAICSAGPVALTSSCGSCCSAALSGSCTAACKTALLTGFLTAARAETALVAGSVVSARSALLASVLAEAALFTGSLTAICAEAALVAGPLTAICAETALVAGSLAASSAEAALLALAVSVSLESALVIAVVAIVTAALAGLLLGAGAWLLICRMLQPVQASFDRQKQFVWDASHEFKTPLAVISANAELLSRQVGPNEYLGYIQSEVKRTDNLVQGLLTLARMDKGTLIASGFIAGGALMGVVSAAMIFFGFKYTSPLGETASNLLAIVMYIALILFLAVSCLRARKDNDQ